eukprot:6914017-Prymnesium_polylepis.1
MRTCRRHAAHVLAPSQLAPAATSQLRRKRARAHALGCPVTHTWLPRRARLAATSRALSMRGAALPPCTGRGGGATARERAQRWPADRARRLHNQGAGRDDGCCTKVRPRPDSSGPQRTTWTESSRGARR